jgi:hypothetical protein
MTTSHTPNDTYYFWGFRCCKDADGAPPWTLDTRYGSVKGPHPVPAPQVAAKDHFEGWRAPENPAGPSKTKFGPRADRNYPPKN